jgi:hypothetical protein
MARFCVTSAAILGVLLAGTARACPLDAIEAQLSHADEHLFWMEFWTETDDGEAKRELAYAIDDLRRAEALTWAETCGDDAVSRATSRIVHARLTACVRQRETSQMSKQRER